MRGVLTLFAVLAVVAILFVAAVVATREGDVLVDAPADGADLALPAGPLQPEDVGELRFGMALRGYRMSEVDAALARLAEELAARDRRVLELERALVDVVEPQVDALEAAAVAGSASAWEPVEPPPHTPGRDVWAAADEPTAHEPSDDDSPIDDDSLTDDEPLTGEPVEAAPAADLSGAGRTAVTQADLAVVARDFTGLDPLSDPLSSAPPPAAGTTQEEEPAAPAEVAGATSVLAESPYDVHVPVVDAPQADDEEFVEDPPWYQAEPPADDGSFVAPAEPDDDLFPEVRLPDADAGGLPDAQEDEEPPLGAPGVSAAWDRPSGEREDDA